MYMIICEYFRIFNGHLSLKYISVYKQLLISGQEFPQPQSRLLDYTHSTSLEQARILEGFVGDLDQKKTEERRADFET